MTEISLIVTLNNQFTHSLTPFEISNSIWLISLKAFLIWFFLLISIIMQINSPVAYETAVRDNHDTTG